MAKPLPMPITQAELKHLFDYNPETGDLTNRISRSFNARVGDLAGGQQGDGYRRVCINGHNIQVHRVVWVYVHGDISPDFQIDHVNHKRSDNRLSNLRLVTHKENGLNQIRHNNNLSGVVGVSYVRREKKWAARIRNDGKLINIGTFTHKHDAVFARKIAEKVLGFHENHGGIS